MVEQEIVIPHFLKGINAKANQNIKLNVFIGPVDIIPKNNHLIRKPEELIEKLLFCYKQNLKDQFYDLFEAKTLEKIKSMPTQEFETEWSRLSSFKKPKLQYYFEQDNGILLGWTAENFPITRVLYMEKKAGQYKIKEKLVGKDDEAFQDLSLYFTYAPINFSSPFIEKKFDNTLQNMRIKLRFNQTDNKWIHIFKKEANKWVLSLAIKDNDTENFRFQDLNPQTGIVELEFKPEHFTKGKTHDLLILESNFPMQDIEDVRLFQTNWQVKS